RRHGEAERLRGPEIDDQLELRRLLNRQVSGLLALKDTIDVTGCAPIRGSRRIASHKNRMTSASAASGAARVRSENRSAPPSSTVAMTELPRPPVKMVDLALSIAVTPCVRPAMPPPAITAAVHFTIGGRSVITAADTTVPATSAAGVAKLSSRL